MSAHTLIQNLQSETRPKQFYSLELSPKEGDENVPLETLVPPPRFASITWIGQKNLLYDDIEEAPAIKTAKHVSKSLPVLLHLTCDGLTESKLDEILALDYLNDFLILRGDDYEAGQRYQSALDLLKAVRDKRGTSAVSLAVAAQLDTSPQNLNNLKRKVCEGSADLIITQLVFSAEKLRRFIVACRAAGINVPILPGVYIPHSHQQLDGMLKITGAEMPIYGQLDDLKLDGEKWRKVVDDFSTRLLEEILSIEDVCGLHFFTLNVFDEVKRFIKRF